MTSRSALKLAGNTLAAIWIIFATAFFLVRFTSVFYRANQDAIQGFFERLSGG